MTDRDRDAIERARETLRAQILDLRGERRRIIGEQERLDTRYSQVGERIRDAEASLKELAVVTAPQTGPVEAPKKERQRRPAVPLEAARAVMAERGTVTIPSLAEAMDVHVSTARRVVTAALEHGGGGEKAMIRDTGREAPPRGGQGRRSKVYEFFKPATQGSQPHSRPRSAPEVELRRRGARPAPTGRKLRVRNPEVRELVEMAKQAGYTPKKQGGHIHLVKPGERKRVLAGSPSEYRGSKNARAEIKRAAKKKKAA